MYISNTHAYICIHWYTQSCNHHDNQDIEQFCESQKIFYCPFVVNYPSFLYHPLMCFLTLDFDLYKNVTETGHIIGGFLSLACFSYHNAFEIHHVVCISSLLLLVAEQYSVPQINLSIQQLKDVCIVSSLGLLWIKVP